MKKSDFVVDKNVKVGQKIIVGGNCQLLIDHNIPLQWHWINYIIIINI